MNEEQEVWRDIPHYEGRYLVSNQGRIFSLLQKKILSQRINPDGYCVISLTCFTGDKSRHQERVHRLVALAFIDNPEHLPEVNHINCIRSDNRVENLEWVSREQNIAYTKEQGHTTYKPIKCLETGEIFAGSYEVSKVYDGDPGNIRKSARSNGKYEVFGKHYAYVSMEEYQEWKKAQM